MDDDSCSKTHVLMLTYIYYNLLTSQPFIPYIRLLAQMDKKSKLFLAGTTKIFLSFKLHICLMSSFSVFVQTHTSQTDQEQYHASLLRWPVA